MKAGSLVSWVVVLLLLAPGFSTVGCFGDDDNPTNTTVSSQSYKGHENDADSNYLVQAYPHLVGTRIDDCQACHRSGVVQQERKGTVQDVELNPCSFCHLIPYPDETVLSGAPATYAQTLNPYGSDYKAAGRSKAAIRSIAGDDSDEDGHTNGDELMALRYPGDPESKPGQPTAPIHTFLWQDLGALAYHEQFMLMNSHRQEFDQYVNYGGVKIMDVLSAAGVMLADTTSITCFAPDGYSKDFSAGDIVNAYPNGVFYPNLGPGTIGERGFVTYPPEDQIPDGLESGATIPDEPWAIVAFKRDRADMEMSYLDAVSGKLSGEGPYRLVVPQGLLGTPGVPDRGSNYSPSGFEDGYDYNDDADHNAGLCVRGLVAIRVNPMPDGYEEFDWKNGGYALVGKRQLIVYGAGVAGN